MRKPSLNRLLLQDWISVFAAQPVAVAYIMSLGLSQSDFALGQAVYMSGMFLAGIPAGWMADAFSRPACIAAGSATVAAASTAYLFAYNLPTVLLVEFSLGVGVSFVNIPAFSLMASYAQEQGLDTGKVYARHAAISTLSGAGFITIGGWIGAEQPGYGHGLTAVLYTIAAVMCLTLEEIRDPLHHMGTAHKRHVFREMRDGIVEVLLRNKKLRWTMLAVSVGTQLGRGLMWIQAALYLQAGVPAVFVGSALATFYLASAAGSFAIGRVISKWSTLRLFMIPSCISLSLMILLGVAFCLWPETGMGISSVTIIIFVALGVTGGSFTVIYRTLLQRQGDQDSLALTKSVAQCLNIILYVVVTALVAWATDAFGVQAGLWANICIFVPLVLLGNYKLVKLRVE